MHALQPPEGEAQWSAPFACPPPPTWPTAYPEGYAVVDVETTGLGRSDRIVSAAVYRLDGRGEVVDHWYSPVNPQRDPGPVWIHGLTSEMLDGAPTFPEVAEELAARLAGRVLVAHNALFDWNMIAHEFLRMGGAAPVEQRLCTIVLSRDLRLPLPNHKLESLAAHFGVEQQRAHHALDDARVLAEAFRPSLRLAAAAGLALPLTACVPPVESADPRPSLPGARSGSSSWGSYRPSRRRPTCPYPNPGRWQQGGPLVQGMRVAFTGDTATDRELLEDRAIEAGLHIASSVSRLTSLLVTNEPGSWSGKARRAREVGTPTMDEQAFLQLLRDVAPHTSVPHPGGPPR
ncbi:DEDDh family exonuclease [Peterkaempfera bronchialis]|uniref:DEDDh family exonuclease n=1 Tax=Peterkaempfera bronchialis TaxID=2126346 RepID=A0A345T231_9ACTN|nr:DEDDh family exonuclease [Peterkaempfera bronchialis]AXI80036.1 DEDDh family exonuclease [Peterkaempfera bronchialis]